MHELPVFRQSKCLYNGRPPVVHGYLISLGDSEIRLLELVKDALNQFHHLRIPAGLFSSCGTAWPWT